ncbi:MAG: hypothetical protein ACFHHU_03255 [Porticoccaceae bacterium]
MWCGYTCPQTVWTAIYIWFEQKVEGSRNQRIKLDQQPMSLGKATRKVIKHALFLGFAFLTALHFYCLFVPARELIVEFNRAGSADSLCLDTVFYPGYLY